MYWSHGGQRSSRTYYQSSSRPQHRGFGGSGGVSQYSDSRYKGPAPMVLGAVSKTADASVVCYHCGRTGHYAKFCRSNTQQSRGGFRGNFRGGFRGGARGESRGGFHSSYRGSSRGAFCGGQQKSVNHVSYPPPPPVQ